MLVMSFFATPRWATKDDVEKQDRPAVLTLLGLIYLWITHYLRVCCCGQIYSDGHTLRRLRMYFGNNILDFLKCFLDVLSDESSTF